MLYIKNMEVVPEESYEDLQEEQYEEDELPDPLEEQYEFEEKYTSKKKNILHKAKGLYDEYVKGSLGPLAVIGGIIALFTTKAGKAVQNMAANTLQGVEKFFACCGTECRVLLQYSGTLFLLYTDRDCSFRYSRCYKTIYISYVFEVESIILQAGGLLP